MNGWSDISISLDPPPVKRERKSPNTRRSSVRVQKSAGEAIILLSPVSKEQRSSVVRQGNEGEIKH